MLISFLGFLVAVAGLRVLTVNAHEEKPTVVISKNETNTAPTVIVHVSGAVMHPGIYTLAENARIADAVSAAGGMRDDADEDWIAQKLNLAQKINDGGKIYIPSKNENRSQDQPHIINAESALISINDATLSELDTLSGVGATTAQKIIDGRPYQSIDELLSRKIVNKATFEKIKEKVSVY